jgi:hypothetical protein
MKWKSLIYTVMVCGTWPLLAQVKPCQSISFSATVSGTERYSREIGGGLWFAVYPDSIYPGGSWTVRIGQGEKPEGRLDVGWSLDRAWTSEWELGPVKGRDAQAAMKLSPRELRFAVSKSNLERLRAAQFRQISSDFRLIESGESDPNKVIAEIPKGLASVRISDYRLSEPQKDGIQQIISVSIAVTITTPSSLQLLGGGPSECSSLSQGTGIY